MYGNCGYGYESFTGAACGNPHLKAVFAHTITPNPYHGWTYENGFYHLAFMSAWSAVQGMNTSMKELGEDMAAFGTKWYPAFLRYYLSGAHRPPRPEHAWEAAPRDLPVSELPVLSELPYWQDWMNHPTYDDFWKASDNIAKAKMGQVKVPVFMLICWYDNSCQANIDLFHELCAQSDPELAKQHRLLIGPWDHSAYYNNRASCAGERDFGFENETGTSLSIPLILGWFKKYLKGEGDGAIPGDNQVRYFQMGEGAWHEEPTWPVATEEKVLFLHSDGGANGADGDGALAGYTCAADETPDTYDYDPLDPTMSVGGRTMLFATGVFDQAEIEKRADVLCYTTPLLKEDIVVAGPIKLDLYAATSAVDTGFFAKLVDVEPDGYVANISEALLAQVEDRVHFHSKVEEAVVEDGKVRGLKIAGKLVEADHVIVGLDAIRTLELVPGLSQAQKDALATCTYSKVFYYQFGLEKPLESLRHSAVFLASNEDNWLAGISQANEDKGYPIILSQSRIERCDELAAMTEEERTAKIIAETRKVLPDFPAKPKIVKNYRWDISVNCEGPGQFKAVNDLKKNHMDDVEGLHLAGDYMFLIASTEGSMDAGRRRAEEILATLGIAAPVLQRPEPEPQAEAKAQAQGAGRAPLIAAAAAVAGVAVGFAFGRRRK